MSRVKRYLTHAIALAILSLGTGGHASIEVPNLTGVWAGDDGGTYYIRTVGTEIFWFGQKEGVWANVFHGIYQGGNRYEGPWVDLPLAPNRNAGTLTIRKEPASDTLVRVAHTGPFQGRTWRKVVRVTRSPAGEDTDRLPPTLSTASSVGT